MEVATRLALYLGCVIVALVIGWAFGQAAVVLAPDPIVPGQAPVHAHTTAFPPFTPTLTTREEI